jgi:AcrR family transcriptional regulator
MKEGLSPKEKLFRTAGQLFFRYGYRAVGVDTIAAESGIGKMTLYRYFPSKDDLIAAYLRDSDRNFWAHFERSTDGAVDAREVLLAFFRGLQDYATSPACYGCPFINIAGEYPEADYPGHQIALEHKQAVRAHFTRLAQAAGAAQPAQLASALMLLTDGAYIAARMYGAAPDSPAGHLAETARQVIDAHCRPVED